MSMFEGDIPCKGRVDKLDPIGNLARFALDTQGGHDNAVAWLKRDITRTEARPVPIKEKQAKVTDLELAIAWIESDKRRINAPKKTT